MSLRPLILLVVAGCSYGYAYPEPLPTYDGERHGSQSTAGQDGALRFAATQSFNCGIAGACELRPIAVGAEEVLRVLGYSSPEPVEVSSSDPSVIEVGESYYGSDRAERTISIGARAPGRATLTVRIGETTDRVEVEAAAIAGVRIEGIPDRVPSCVTMDDAAELRVVAVDDRDRELLGAGVGAWSADAPDVYLSPLSNAIVDVSVDEAQRVNAIAVRATSATIEVHVGDASATETVRFAQRCE